MRGSFAFVYLSSRFKAQPIMMFRVFYCSKTSGLTHQVFMGSESGVFEQRKLITVPNMGPPGLLLKATEVPESVAGELCQKPLPHRLRQACDLWYLVELLLCK